MFTVLPKLCPSIAYHFISFVSSFSVFLLLSLTLHLNVSNVAHGFLVTLISHPERVHQILKPSIAKIQIKNQLVYFIYLFIAKEVILNTVDKRL